MKQIALDSADGSEEGTRTDGCQLAHENGHAKDSVVELILSRKIPPQHVVW
jgi:hypothetical protein